MTVPQFQIIAQATDENEKNLVLTLNWAPPAAYTVVAAARADAPQPYTSIDWTPVEWIDNGNDLGFILLNQETNMVLIAPEDKQSVQVKPLENLTSSDRAFWRFIGSGYAGALQLQANTDMNLNIFGGGPYQDNTTVGVYTWGHSQPNEMWLFSPSA